MKSIPCSDCMGLGKSACTSCGGTARIRSKYDDGSKAGTKSCSDCSKTGTHPCGECKKGRIDCSGCKDGRARGDCGQCSPPGRVICSCLMAGRHRPYAVLGDMLAEAGLRKQALAFYERALRRAQREDRKGKVIRVGRVRVSRPVFDRKKVTARLEKRMEELRARLDGE